MSEFFLSLDYWFFDLINQKGAFTWGDLFFPWVTDLNQTLYFKLFIAPFFIFIFVQKYKRLGLSLFLMMCLSLAVSDFFGAQVKNYFMRPRPFQNPEITATQKSPAGSKSFYSNHAANMFTLATFTSQFVPPAGIPLFILAFTISYSRVYNGVHYPSDVIAGAVMGLILGYIFSMLARKLMLKLHHRQKSSS